jgi:ABC-type amino acid transport substrate-binding protein
MEAIGKNMGFKLNWKTEVDLGTLTATLESNKIDMLCGSIWPASGRMQSLTLTIPPFYTPAYAYVRADDSRFDGDLSKGNNKSVKIAAIDGDYTYDLATELLPQATINSMGQATSGSEILMQVITKKSDIVFSDEGLVNDFLKTNPGTLRKVKGIAAARIYGETFAVKRGEYQLKNMLDLSINQLTNDGVIEKLVNQYNKEKQSHFFAPAKSFIGK